MAVYLGNSKNSDAARTALKINYSVKEIINPAIKAQYPWTSYTLAHVVGIDTSNLFVARIGVRGDNDLCGSDKLRTTRLSCPTEPALLVRLPLMCITV